jgi:hypothetical protein
MSCHDSVWASDAYEDTTSIQHPWSQLCWRIAGAFLIIALRHWGRGCVPYHPIVYSTTSKIAQGPEGKVWDRWGWVLNFECYRTRQSKYRAELSHTPHPFAGKRTRFRLFVLQKPSFCTKTTRPSIFQSNAPRPPYQLLTLLLLWYTRVPPFYTHLYPSYAQPLTSENRILSPHLPFYMGPQDSRPCQVSLSLVICWSVCMVSSRLLLLPDSFVLLCSGTKCGSYSCLCSCYLPQFSPSLYSPVLLCTISLGIFSSHSPTPLNARSNYPAYRHRRLLLSTLPLLARYSPLPILLQCYPRALGSTPTVLVLPSFPRSYRRQPCRAIR